MYLPRFSFVANVRHLPVYQSCPSRCTSRWWFGTPVCRRERLSNVHSSAYREVYATAAAFFARSRPSGAACFVRFFGTDFPST